LSKSYIEFNVETHKLFRVKQSVEEIDLSEFTKHIQVPAMQLCPMIARGTFIACSKDATYLIQELTSIPFLVTFQVESTKKKDAKNGDKETQVTVYVPDFRGLGIRSNDVQLEYTPPSDQRLWLIVEPISNMSYLVAQDSLDGQLFYPGLPNVYADTHLCLGQTTLPPFDLAYARGVSPFLSEWLKCWGKAEFNSDLNTDGAGSVETMCRFDENGKNILPEDWRDVLPKVAPAGELREVMAELYARTKDAEEVARKWDLDHQTKEESNGTDTEDEESSDVPQ